MTRYEYTKLALACIPDEIIEQYSLRTLSSDGWIYIEIRKGMPGLKKASRIANDQLKAHLANFGFAPVPRTPALWMYLTPKSSTKREKNMGLVSCFHSAGVLGTGAKPKLARRALSR